MSILGIDPGTEKSAYVMYDKKIHSITEFGIVTNERILDGIERGFTGCDDMVIEMVSCYGMPVGREVFETVYWIGRFCEAWHCVTDIPFTRIYRRDVKLYLCNSMQATDANISQAIRDKFPSTGGGKRPQIGTKKQPGPLYGIKADMWSALAVALTYVGTKK